MFSELYKTYSSEKLKQILLSPKGSYTKEAIDCATETLIQRGESIDLENLYYEKLNQVSDEDLGFMFVDDRDKLKEIEIQTISKILLERGYELPEVEQESKEEVSDTKKKVIEKNTGEKINMDVFLLILGIILFLVKLYFRMNENEYYQFLKDYKWFLWGGIHFLSLLLIMNYEHIQRDTKKSLLWIILAIFMGPIALISVTISQIFKKSSSNA